MGITRRAAAVVLGAVLASGCGTASPRQAANVLLIVVDTLRADRLGAYGSVRGLTPFLDALAARGIVFHRAYASSCWTNPSVASLFTSRHAWQHGVTLLTPLAAAETTLAESLADRGYDTAGYSANFLVSEPLGYAQGFRTYATPAPRKTAAAATNVPVRAEALNQMILEWWHERRSRHVLAPAFVYVQYMEPHWPYAPPPAVLDALYRDGGRPDVDAANGIYFLASTLPAGDPRVQVLEPIYDAEVRALDTGLAQLFQALEQEKFLDNAVVVVTADHGEAFWDHGNIGHGGSLFEELIHVPLIVLVPANRTRIDVDQVVSLVDVAPTVLDLVGVAPPASFAGHSLAALMTAPSARNVFGVVPARPWSDTAYSDMALNVQSAQRLAESAHRPHHLRSVVVGSKKMITTLGGDVEYYDLERDPHEQGGVALTARDQEALRDAMNSGRVPAGVIATGAEPVPEEQKERLRALGYVH